MSGEKPIGVLLAGGLARRMGGGDKGRQLLDGTTLLDRAIARATPQVDPLILNANGNGARFADTGLAVVADVIEGFAGPLAGVLTGMEWAQEHRPDAGFIATFATDAPFFPDDLVARLCEAVASGGADMACASSGGRTHPVFAIWPVRLAGALRQAMVDEDMRKIDRWTARYNIQHVDFSTDPFDPFFNVNTLEDLAEAEGLLAVSGAEKMRSGQV